MQDLYEEKHKTLLKALKRLQLNRQTMPLDGNYRYVKMTALALLTYIFKAFGDRHTVSFITADTGG